MPEKWTGEIIGIMHNNRIRYIDVAEKMGITKAYLSQILSGTRKTKGIQQRIESAVNELIEEREARTA